MNMDKLIKFLLCGLTLLLFFPSFSQTQVCPDNINFSADAITNWSALTGLKDTTTYLVSITKQKNYPSPNTGISVIPEYTIQSTGIQVITSSSADLYGGFPTIPTINGYQYTTSVKLGSTANSHDMPTSGNPGGFVRAISYSINVPAGSASTPYTMTYAYALVLENGTHTANSQPLFKATLATKDSTISCASPKYYLPTTGSTGTSNGTGAPLDTAAALADGFTNSKVLFRSYSGTSGNNGTLLQDVWTKGWTEVTFDLSPYRGQTVTLTFETDNCAPGAHFAYAYVALRNSCAGLVISGDSTVCTNSSLTYSIPALAGASYQWSVPDTWQITSGTASNTISVIPGSGSGIISVREQNSCADLANTLPVTAIAPSLGGIVSGDNSVCSDANTSTLSLSGYNGSIREWVSSPDGITWGPLTDTTASYTATDLTTTTLFKAVVQNGTVCLMDTSSGATIIVYPKSVGGSLSPANISVCESQDRNAALTLTGNTGAVSNWITSTNSTDWQSFNPVKTDSVYNLSSTPVPTQYRVIVKSGVCSPDTSSIAYVQLYPARYPAAVVSPEDTTICFGSIASLNVQVTSGSSYTWSGPASLYDSGDGSVSSVPSSIQVQAAPPKTTYYILNMKNGDCPNILTDTIHINVIPPVIVNAGHDTSVVINQLLQLQASVNDTTAYNWLWTPATGLDNTTISNPVTVLSGSTDSIRYVVRATDPAGCYGEGNILVTVYKTDPEIFVPGAFTPNGDGKNDIIKPVTVGITQLDYFRIYNRWGQLLFSTGEMGAGWDGTFNGTRQPSGTYVYMTAGTDYKGNKISRKGTVVLIR
jgi:gliding motility-associated-like protein